MKKTLIQLVAQYGLMDGFNAPRPEDWTDIAVFSKDHVGSALEALKQEHDAYEKRSFQGPTMFRIIERVTTVEETVLNVKGVPNG